MVNHLPSPLPGLLIAAICGATMATVSAGVNALATATMMDFGRTQPPSDRITHDGGMVPSACSDGDNVDAHKDAAAHILSQASDRHQLNRARILTILFGVIPTILALFVVPHCGTLVESIIKIFGLFGGPLLGIFFLGVLTTRTNGNGALIGAACGGIVGLFVLFSGPLWNYPISFLWIAFTSALATWVAGWLASLFFAAPSPMVVAKLVHHWCRYSTCSDTERQIVSEQEMSTAFCED